MDNNERFQMLSKDSHERLRKGDLRLYSYDLREMARILDAEGKYIDEVKLLMIVFYVDLSGGDTMPFVSEVLVETLKKAMLRAALSPNDVKKLYFDTIREDITPSHRMTINDTFTLFNRVFTEDFKEIRRLIANIVYS